MAENNDIDLRRLKRSICSLKWIYLLSLIIMLGLAATYCWVKQPQYNVMATMLIEDSSNDSPGGLSIGSSALAALAGNFKIGGLGSSSVDNEVLLVNSHDVLLRTAKALRLNRTVYLRDGLSKQMLYPDAPVAIEGPEEMFDTLVKAIKLDIELHRDGTADITAKTGMLGRTIGSVSSSTLPVTVTTELGPLTVLSTDTCAPADMSLRAVVTGYESVVDFLYNEIDVDIADKKADALTFELLYPSRPRGRAILNTLMAQYNAKRVGRKHQTALEEVDFLDQRIATLVGHIDSLETAYRDFRVSNNFVNVEAEAPLLSEVAFGSLAEQAELRAKESLLRALLAQIDDPAKAKDPLPAFDEASAEMLSTYNDAVVQLNNLSHSASENSPTYQRALDNLEVMRKAVRHSVATQLEGMQMAIKSQTKLASQSSARLGQYPKFEQELTELYRDRQMSNALYMYLLQKRESAMLQLSSTSSLGYVVDEAYTELKPSRKKSFIICLAALALALIIPTCLALYKLHRSRTVDSPIDLAASGLEEHCIALKHTDPLSVSRLRSMLDQSPVRSLILVAGDAAREVSDRLASSWNGIGIQAEILTTEKLGLPHHNDSLLTPVCREAVSAVIQRNHKVLLQVPDVSALEIIRSMLESQGSQLLLAVTPGALPRKSAAQAANLGHVTVALLD